MKLKVKKLIPNAEMPRYATEGAACFDLKSVEDGVLREFDKKVYRTGLAFEVPEGYVMLIFSRSGQGFNQSIRLSNCVGVVDSDYRGEVKVALHKDSAFSAIVSRGDRIAQAMIVPAIQVDLEEVDALTETNRGSNGFGSTGR